MEEIADLHIQLQEAMKTEAAWAGGLEGPARQGAELAA
jgi:hypothetical protein